jgi:hypothetical protein
VTVISWRMQKKHVDEAVVMVTFDRTQKKPVD